MRSYKLVVYLAVVFLLGLQHGLLAAQDMGCRPDVLSKPTQQGLWVVGETSGFDPCHPSVQWRVPENADNPAVVLAVHGGGGRRDAQAITDQFYQHGYATLIFDAYAMNGFTRTPRLGNAARQLMLFKVASEALIWLKGRTEIGTRNIHVYGISNGASVVLNLAALGPPYEIRSVFSEAPTPVGMGLPDTIRVPTLMVFGQEDDLGAPLGKKRWEISMPCRINVKVRQAPSGTATDCSKDAPNGRMMTTVEWSKKVMLVDAGRLDTMYLDGVAHGGFLGPLERSTWADFMRSRGVTPQPFMEQVGWSQGGTEAGRAALLREVLDFFAATTAK